MVLISIFLISNNIQHHFICLFIIYISPLVRLPSNLLSKFWGCLYSYYWVVRVLSIVQLQILYQIDIFQILSSSPILFFILLTVSFKEQMFFVVIKSNLSLFFFNELFLLSHLRAIYLNQNQIFFLFSSRIFTLLGL